MGLVQRVLEEHGIATVSLSMIPDLTRATGVPRLAGIAYPMGRPMGQPGDAAGQREVLRATLRLLESAPGPGAYEELPFAWPESPGEVSRASRDVPPPPIADLLRRRPWLLADLYSGKIPAEE